MKRLIYGILTFVVLVLFCSCGDQKLSGTYSDNLGFSSLEFNGEKVILTTPTGTSVGTYEVKGNAVIINYDNGNSDTLIYNEDSNTLNFYDMLTYSKENVRNSELLTAISENESIEEPEAISKSEEKLSSWEFYEENNTVPTPDSSVKGVLFTEISNGFYIYNLSDNSYDADMNFKAYGAVLLGCGFTIENENGAHMILDESGVIVGAMATGKEGDSYFLMIHIL